MLRTGFYTFCAAYAFFAVYSYGTIFDTQSLLRAVLYAVSAFDAYRRSVCKLPCSLLGFRVCAPEALQRAALKKDRSPYSRAVFC